MPRVVLVRQGGERMMSTEDVEHFYFISIFTTCQQLSVNYKKQNQLLAGFSSVFIKPRYGSSNGRIHNNFSIVLIWTKSTLLCRYCEGRSLCKISSHLQKLPLWSFLFPVWRLNTVYHIELFCQAKLWKSYPQRISSNYGYNLRVTSIYNLIQNMAKKEQHGTREKKKPKKVVVK